MRLVRASFGVLAAASFLAVAGPAAAAPDEAAAVKACKKEMNWSSMKGTQKRSPAVASQLDACVKGKLGK